MPMHTTGGLTTDALVLAALKTNLNNYTKAFIDGVSLRSPWGMRSILSDGDETIAGRPTRYWRSDYR